MNTLYQWLDTINRALDLIVPVLLSLAILAVEVRYIVRRSRWQGKQYGLWLGVLLLLPTLLVISIWLGYSWILSRTPSPSLFLLAFPALIALPGLFLIYFLTRRYGGRRGIYAASVHGIILLAGWMTDRWLGILFLSLPLLLFYYLGLYYVALVAVPASNPGDRQERRRRFQVLLSYHWGLQSPLYVVADSFGRQVECRIRGPIVRNFLDIPGLLWTHSHQVAGITSGVQFRRVDGPGVIFLQRLERPFQVVDLRNQLRVSELDVTSQDGIPYKAILFMAFRVDREVWPEDLYKELREKNPLLRGANHLSFVDGAFPFAHNRVQSVLTKTGVNAERDAHIRYWDQWAVSQIEGAARQELIRHPVDSFWQLEGGVTNTLEIISQRIREQAEPVLRVAGIHLLTARVVNFRFAGKGEAVDPISRQQIRSWQAFWERKTQETLSLAEAEASRMQQEAWAYAQSLLLVSIAEGFSRARALHPDLPPSTLALLFLSAVQDYLARYQVKDEERIAGLQPSFMHWLQGRGERDSGNGD